MKSQIRIKLSVIIFAALYACSHAGIVGAGEAVSSVRMPFDTVGYADGPLEIEAVVRLSDSLEAERYSSNALAFPRMSKGGMLAAICPHDDYLYAGPVYVHVMREVRAPRVVLFGVSHTARRRDIQGKLIFDDFEAWRGPYGECPVSSLREAVIRALPEDLVLVSNEVHSEEHSLEAFVPFLQYYVKDVEILPILVSRLKGPLFKMAADTLAAILGDEIRGRGWQLGRDIVILISADCVHYGDDKWGGRNYAPFGVDEQGYDKGVEQDLDIVSSSLTGPLSLKHIALFREKVERDDFQWPYKVTWCGVYSIPFGLCVLSRLSELTGGGVPEGFMLRYATSLNPGRLPLDNTGLGVTSINTLRHWVGYAAVGYW